MVIRAAIDVDKLVREGDDQFMINSRIYLDPAVFELEMERIFGRAWVYVAHESEVAQPGDYKTALIGRQPVIVTRDADDGQVYVLYNRCRHRGATVCQEEYGNASYFRCAYHGWTYRNRGDLVSVPMKEGYGPRFDTSELGLVRAPRVDSYRGLIFASLAADGPSLEEHLGNARPYIDRFASPIPEGIVVRSGVQKSAYSGNWKYALENVVDSYHFTVVHQVYIEILKRRRGRGYHKEGVYRTWDLGNGHAVLDVEADGAAPADDPYGINSTGGSPGFNLLVFPNIALLFGQIRVIRPLAPGRTEVWIYPVALKGAPPEMNVGRLRSHEDFYGPASFAQPEDIEIFTRLWAGQQAKGDEWVLLSRGLYHEETDEHGSRFSTYVEESSQRAIYRQWRRVMTAD